MCTIPLVGGAGLYCNNSHPPFLTSLDQDTSHFCATYAPQLAPKGFEDVLIPDVTGSENDCLWVVILHCDYAFPWESVWHTVCTFGNSNSCPKKMSVLLQKW